MQVRTVPAGRPEDFVCPVPGFVDRSAQLTRLWEQGSSRPQWCFLAPSWAVRQLPGWASLSAMTRTRSPSRGILT